MAIAINGSGTVTGISVGGLPDGCVDTDTLATSVTKGQRKAEYPTIEDQLDDIYHNGIDAWKATIKVTKDKYPKP